MKDKVVFVLFGIIIGIVISLLIYAIPTIRYDVNSDGKVTLGDAVKIVDYYTDKRH